MLIPIFYADHNGPTLYASEPSPPFIPLSLEYLSEGGANTVFRILATEPHQQLPSPLRGRLLRLRKDLPHVDCAENQIAAFETHFKPLFPPENLVQHELIKLESGLLSLINEFLRSISRPSRRAQDRLPLHETHGLLVTDMTPGAGQIVVQMKPKWLAQSPNAPSNAVRCRTCALRAKRTSHGKSTATDAQEHCSLAHLSPIDEDRFQIARDVTEDVLIQNCLSNKAVPLFQRLRGAQIELDPAGVLSEHDEGAVSDLCKAMTLRDCTLFLKRTEDEVEFRLADLDLKQVNKLNVWKETERALISEGWYENTEQQQFWTKETVCVLSQAAG